MSGKKLYAVLYFPQDKKTDIVALEQLPVEDRYEGCITKVKWRGTEYPALIEKISGDSDKLDAAEDKIGKRIEVERMMDGSGTTASRRRHSRPAATHRKDYASEQEVAMALGEKKPVPKQHLVAKKNAAASAKKVKVNREKGVRDIEETLLSKIRKEQRRGPMPENTVTAEGKLTPSLIGGGDSQEMSDSSDAPSYVFTRQKDIIEDTPQKTRKQDEERKEIDENRNIADESTPQKSKCNRKMADEFTPNKSTPKKSTPKKSKRKDLSLSVSPVKFAATAAQPRSRSPSQPPSQELLSTSYGSQFEDDNEPATQSMLQKLKTYYNPSVKMFLTELISCMEEDAAATEGESANIVDVAPLSQSERQVELVKEHGVFISSSGKSVVLLSNVKRDLKEAGGKGTSKEGSKKMLIALLQELFKDRQKLIRGTRSIRPHFLKAIIAFMDKHSEEKEKLTLPEIKRVINVTCSYKRRDRSKEKRVESNKDNPESTPNKKATKYSRLKKKSTTATSVITQSPVKPMKDMRSPIKFQSPSGEVIEVPRLQSRTPAKHKPLTEHSCKTSQSMEPPTSQQTQHLIPTWSQSHIFHNQQQEQQAPYYPTQPPQQNYSVPWNPQSYPAYNLSQTLPSQQHLTYQNEQRPQSQWPSQNVEDTDTSNTFVRPFLMDL